MVLSDRSIPYASRILYSTFVRENKTKEKEEKENLVENGRCMVELAESFPKLDHFDSATGLSPSSSRESKEKALLNIFLECRTSRSKWVTMSD